MNTLFLPSFNACLNAASAFLAAGGFLFIKRGKKTQHHFMMLGAFAFSMLFLISYIFYHAEHGATSFQGGGWIRPVYFSILISHSVLAVVVVPLTLTVLYFAMKEQFSKHKRLARVTLPLWLYVSVTGVVIYWMLYRL